MIRSEYDYNNIFNRNSGRGAFLSKLFAFTSIGGLDGHRQLPTIWLIDWDWFLPRGAARPATPARPIDIQISGGMNALPRQTTDPAHADIAQRIADRNLLRGYYRRLPSGQLLAEALNADIVSGEKILGMMLSQGEAADQDQARTIILANGLHEAHASLVLFPV